ncbi:MAG TPA: phage terminase small subunit P27 family [Mesorhizobium sp.]|jgi:P27 family predicted phage terminase small subunit|nr:phage terminase small subunit P27 family [Mesorhizobium sp.]
MRGLNPSTIVPGTSRIERTPPAPSDLNKDARAEWKRVAPILTAERDVLTVADLGVLRTYVVHFALVKMAQREIDRDGLVINGKRHPAYGVLKESSQLQLRAAGELGLTPYSRSRAAIVGASDDEPSPLDV